MKFLVDTSPKTMSERLSNLIGGQLVTPLTSYANWGDVFAIDNGAFSKFNKREFHRILRRDQQHKNKCLFVTVPDVVGNGRRTLEIWRHRERFKLVPGTWPLAFVAQDGVEDLDIPWPEMACLFVGGGDPWKDSRTAADIVKTAKTFGLRVHVGRVNSLKRYEHFKELGADTCDGSGIAKYDHMLEKIETGLLGDQSTQSSILEIEGVKR